MSGRRFSCIEMEPGARGGDRGPAVVAIPYGNDLNSETLVGEINVKPNDISDLAWIPAGHERAVLWGCWKARCRAQSCSRSGAPKSKGSRYRKLREPLKRLHAHAEDRTNRRDCANRVGIVWNLRRCRRSLECQNPASLAKFFSRGNRQCLCGFRRFRRKSFTQSCTSGVVSIAARLL